uniref:Transmembrane protein n=1 Tax=Palpitomonas bilix TaxID=652834 RepID=A0A7S3DDM6_9EUKA
MKVDISARCVQVVGLHAMRYYTDMTLCFLLGSEEDGKCLVRASSSAFYAPLLTLSAPSLRARIQPFLSRIFFSFFSFFLTLHLYEKSRKRGGKGGDTTLPSTLFTSPFVFLPFFF